MESCFYSKEKKNRKQNWNNLVRNCGITSENLIDSHTLSKRLSFSRCSIKGCSFIQKRKDILRELG